MLTFASQVENDLDAIASYIAQDSLPRAYKFISKIGDQFTRIEQNPLIYRLRPEIGAGARLATVGRYVVLFRIVGEDVEIGRVVHGNRDLSRLLP